MRKLQVEFSLYPFQNKLTQISDPTGLYLGNKLSLEQLALKDQVILLDSTWYTLQCEIKLRVVEKVTCREHLINIRTH